MQQEGQRTLSPKKCSMDLAIRKSVVTLPTGILMEWSRKQKPDCSEVGSEQEVSSQVMMSADNFYKDWPKGEKAIGQ